MRLQHQPSTLVLATPASALVFGGDLELPASAYDVKDEAGEQALHLASLAVPRDPEFPYDLNGDNCILRWARIPAKYSGPVDVVIHFHGHWNFKRGKAATLGHMARSSGIELRSPGVGRPTLGLVPHGVPFKWYDEDDGSRVGDGFNFPQVLSQAKMEAFVDEALQRFSTLRGGSLSRGRLVLTCHSGGWRAVDKLLAALKDYRMLCGCEFFDATYGGLATLTAADGWVARAIARDAAALGKRNDEERRRYLQDTAAHLRIVFIDKTGTAKVAKDTETFLRKQLDAVTDPGVRELLRKRFRAQAITDTSKTWHGRVPEACGGRLLADPANDLSPEAADLPAPAARAQAYEDWVDESVDAEGAQALDWEAEAQDVTMPQKKMERPPIAPTGSEFIASLGEKKGVERENRIFEQLKSGNIPPSLLAFHTVRLTGKDKSGTSHDFEYYVTPDVLCIGSESDNVRIPMDPVTAQRVADFFECLLPTARMVEQVYQAAPTKLAFIEGNYAGTSRAKLQDATSEYLVHSRKIDAQLRRPPTILTAGHKKELVISRNYIHPRKDKETGEVKPAATLAFYGAFTAAGVPYQAPRSNGQVMRGWPSFAHGPGFVDYSHGVRLVWPTMKVDGATRTVADVLKDPQLSTLIAAEGPIPNPRYTLDRSGKPATAKSQALASDDPLALGTWEVAGALGYGSTWDARIRSTVEDFLALWKAIPVKVGTQTVNVHPPYYINVNDKSGAASKERAKLAEQHRAAAPAALRSLIGEKRFLNTRIGKATTDSIRELLEAADAKGVLVTDAVVGGSATPDTLRAFLKHYGLGVDCSGFVAQAINKLVGLFNTATAADSIAAPHSTNSAALKGGQGPFERVTDPAHLCGGDTMWLSGHIRILAWAERRGDRIVFCTAESRSSNPKDIGPAVAYWRLVPDKKAGTANFTGWRLERSGDLAAADSAWAPVNTTHVYGHYKPLRKLLQAAGGTPAALADDEAWALQAPARFGVAFVPRQGVFNDAPAVFTVVPASFLPEPTTATTAAIDAALTTAGLTPAQRGRVPRAGLVPIAAAFGASALTELFARLRWEPAFFDEDSRSATPKLVQRLLLHVPGHFRELARRTTSAAEAFVLECLGWAMLSHLRREVENATGTRWWIPPAPDWVTAVPNPIPAVSAEVRQVITRLGFIDTAMPAGNWNGRYASWRRGLAGRQWDSELNAATPGLPLYSGLLTVPAHVNTAVQRAAFKTAWDRRVAAVDAAHPPLVAGAPITLDGLLNAEMLRTDAPGNAPAGALGMFDLQGVELARGTFPLRDGGGVATRMQLLNQLHPVAIALFRALRELGWNDLLYQTSGAIAFRGVKHNPRIVVTTGGPIGAPFSAPTQAKVNRLNTDATPASRAAVIAAAISAHTMSDHAPGIAMDLNYPENVDNVAARPFGSMDPRIVALFEAFHFRWGARFAPTDPHHFEYCKAPCAPAAVAGRPAPAAGALPGMIPNFPSPGRPGQGGTAVA
ncbi:M15 family metallopeptidase [Ramlibacter sp. USB13]|uniref:M15 family metallopeptidase n=1 Tax=Ramlibacter cellulosilyticus TaxID=2764187 RepID=A0A923MT60_9BURK|nr:M15 family metallopeptidase [Ramlibacter cellulosilyticus]MBC5784501.1 M15 family metallopeptidase [Ramlibacter cellulosilyticus]